VPLLILCLIYLGVLKHFDLVQDVPGFNFETDGSTWTSVVAVGEIASNLNRVL